MAAILLGSTLSAFIFAEPPLVEPTLLETIVVTASGSANTLADTAASMGVITEQEITELSPAHAGELMNRIPGVNIVQVGSSGEGVMAAIRQPVSTSPVYLYLENGVPTRAAGFFNHNALYEVNTSAAYGVEIIKGPGSALYGSDAIGAVVNVLSGRPPKKDKLSVGVEGGEDGFGRVQINGAKVTADHGFTGKLDLVENDGWREQTSSERSSFTGSWNTDVSANWRVNTVFTGTILDYETGGSGLLYNDYKDDPEQFGNLIGYRDVRGFRLSSAFERDFDNSTLSITPFLRNNDLEYVATWTLNTGRVSPPPPWCPSCPSSLDSQDAHINESGHDSMGTLIKWDYSLSANSFVVTGLDIDYSEGYQKQTYIQRTDTDPGDYWIAFTPAGLLYDYDVDVLSLSPFVHYESQLTSALRLNAGLRYDYSHYDYTDNMGSTPVDPLHLRPQDQSVDFNHLSPKLGLTYQFSDDINGYASYRHAFRVPSSGQLFRSGSTVDSTDLDPVKVDSFDIGLRGNLTDRIAFDSSIYYMLKEDDILSVLDSSTGARRNTNAGETEHYGIELGFDIVLTETVDLYIAYTQSEHKYKDWKDRSGDYSDNDMPNAPENFANVRLRYGPTWLNSGRIELEWIHQGEHWIDEKNSDDGRPTDRDTYDGHDLLNLRANYLLSPKVEVSLRVLNVTDELYAETTGKWGPTFTPGRPRTAYIGAKYTF
ncbi:MAG: TonB-dependent receptor [Cellvibrionales bacterium]|nr:MAG: TonB-dependent receptor [Cellvibrionales bacterium]